MGEKGKPPHLRIAYNPRENCGTCGWYHPDAKLGVDPVMFKKGRCAMYNGYTVYSHETCDKREAGIPGTKGKLK